MRHTFLGNSRWCEPNTVIEECGPPNGIPQTNKMSMMKAKHAVAPVLRMHLDKGSSAALRKYFSSTYSLYPL